MRLPSHYVEDVGYLPDAYAVWTAVAQRDYLRLRLAEACAANRRSVDRQAFLEERQHSLERLVRGVGEFVNNPERVR